MSARLTSADTGHTRLIPRGRARVVIAGGGVAALETLLALRAIAGHVVDIRILSPTREFIYNPVTVAQAFDRGQAHVYDLAEIDPDERIAVSGGGRRIPFD